MKIDDFNKYQVLVVTGPESSGKTTLANLISDLYNIPLVKEYAREYLMDKKALDADYKYSFFDLLKIAERQIELEEKASTENKLIVCDTDIITIEIWANEKFNKSLDINHPHRDQKLYILCKPDIPWEPDPLRENEADRDRLFQVYKEYLESNHLNFIEAIR